MKRFSIFLMLIFITGCIGEQSGNTNPTRSAVKGQVILEEYSGSVLEKKQAQVLGIFNTHKSNPIVEEKSFYQAQSRKDVTECQVKEVTRDDIRKGIRVNASVSANALVSVGEVKFEYRKNSGEIISETYLDETVDHAYGRVLNFDLSSDSSIHTVFARGSKETYPFRAPIPFPIQFENAMANTVEFTATPNSPTLLQKTENFILEWSAPKDKKGNLMMLEIDTMNSEKKKSVLLCDAMEDQLPESSGKVIWEIPSSKFSKLYATTSGAIYLDRAQGGSYTDDRENNFFVLGKRTLVNRIFVAE